jgi:outer membrane receptor protein involved in Fe transport/Tfp pilus assembly protein PilF
LISKEGDVDWSQGGSNWGAAPVGQKLHVSDRLRTLALSRAMVQLAELGRVRLSEMTTLEILPPPEKTGSRATLDLKAGAMYFFTRDRPREFLIQTPDAVAASRGTEFLVALDPAGRTVFTVFDGVVELSNAQGSLTLTNGEQGIAQAGQAPVKTPVLQATNVVQWWLYYPGVLDSDELPLSAVERNQLGASLAAYKSGALKQALENYPAGRVPQSDAERVYYAGLLLSVGRVDLAQTFLASLDPRSPPVNALRQVIAVAASRSVVPGPPPVSATGWLARSYVEQSAFDLTAALAAARAAVEKSPGFGFARARVVELEFSRGATAEAKKDLAKSLELSPRNGEAWVLQGFLLAADRRWDEAGEAFNQAILLDNALGNGWLGRGLMRLRDGDTLGGRADLQTAAAMEPNRSLLRSYLGKAFNNAGQDDKAEKELRLARQLDQNDPTPELYSALLLRQELKFNDAVRDLEASARLNDNRRVYRSRLLLDEDQAVRSASLATIYQDAGMNEVSTREAARAVASDYGNYSAHRFLAESYNELRDPSQFNLRYNEVWFNELLLANLLAPVGAGNLSQTISQQEYSRLFEGNSAGFTSDFEGRSDGQYREVASQFGTRGNFGYSLDLDYEHDDGVRPNNALSSLVGHTTVKYQISPRDSVLVLARAEDVRSGDEFQYYDQSEARTNYTFREQQLPQAVLGYHREWAPGVHTLFLGGLLKNVQSFSDQDVDEQILSRDINNNVVAASTLPFDVSYRSKFQIYTSELNQIFQFEHHVFILGGRYQQGTVTTTDNLGLGAAVAPGLIPFFNNPPAAGDFEDRFERISGYGYYTWEPWENLQLTGGVAYDRLTVPVDSRNPPVAGNSTTRDQLSPKAALVWSPLPEVTLRGTYTRSLGGYSSDESFRLEPTELAGFVQSFRNIIPESLVGSVSAPRYTTAGAALDLKFKSQTYFGFEGQWLNSKIDQQVGAFNYNGLLPPPPTVTPSTTPEQLTYDQYSLTAGVNQLVSASWSLGARYNFTRTKLHDFFSEIAPIDSAADARTAADLHQVSVFVLINHKSGFFGRFESLWYCQDNGGYATPMPGDSFFQHNILVGYRLKRQYAEIRFGVLNLTGTDYHLNPLSYYAELPRTRVFFGGFKMNL